MKFPFVTIKVRNRMLSLMSFLAVALLFSLFSSCNSSNPEYLFENSDVSDKDDPAFASEPLRVLIDVEFATSYLEPHVDTGCASLLTNYRLCGGKADEVIFEFLPKDGEERAAALTHMRTEIMTGKGPDLFICACTRPNKEEQALFQFPTQVMDRKLFLPLDSFIEEAKFTDFDRLFPLIVMQGRNEEGQQVIPLAFSIPMTIFSKSDVQHEHSKTMTRGEMLSSDDYLRQSAVVPAGPCSFLSTGFKELADYENETLSFSEENLNDYLLNYYEQSYGEDQSETPNNYKFDLAVDFIESVNANVTYRDEYSDTGFRSNDKLTMVPIYSAEGGYVAYITSFAAINRNTKKPHEAFALLDYLLSPSGGCSELYGYLTYHIGMPANMDIGTEEMPVSDILGKWYLSDENYQEYCSLRDNASVARFSTPLENDFVEAYLNICRSYYKKSQGEPADEPEKIIADAYRVMKMELAES